MYTIIEHRLTIRVVLLSVMHYHRFFYSIICNVNYTILFINILWVIELSIFLHDEYFYYQNISIRGIYLFCNVYQRCQAATAFHIVPLPAAHKRRLTTDDRRRSPSPTARHDV